MLFEKLREGRIIVPEKSEIDVCQPPTAEISSFANECSVNGDLPHVPIE